MKKTLLGFVCLLPIGVACSSPAQPAVTAHPAGGQDGQARPTTTASEPTEIALPAVTYPAATGISPALRGRVTYRLGERLYLLDAEENAMPFDASAVLDTFDPGTDEWINISPDGNWLVLSAERGDERCKGWACLLVAPADFSGLEVVLIDGEPLHPEYVSAVASGGDAIVFVDSGGPHSRDLWLTQRQAGAWSEAVLLTADSPYDYNVQPAVAGDSSRVVFACGPTPYALEGSAICEVNVDGSGLRVLLTPDRGPGGGPTNALRQPDYAPDGSIVFEADWGGERIWRLLPESGQAFPVDRQANNDNSPCVLPNGSIVSLWLDRPGSHGIHEIKVARADGSQWEMLLTGQDVLDIGLGCGSATTANTAP
ncbi:MAG: hypothetical protein ACOYYS_14245 [Chloroflexota bacterium]